MRAWKLSRLRIVGISALAGLIARRGNTAAALPRSSLPPRLVFAQCTLANHGQGQAAPRGRPRATALAAAPHVAAGVHLPRVVLLVLFILVDCGQALVMDWAEKRSWMKDRVGRQYARQTALVMESGLSVVTGLSLATLLGTEGLVAFWPLVVRFFPVAVCFAVGLSLKMMAVNHFQAGTIKIMGQFRLALVAVASTFIMSRRNTHGRNGHALRA
ncbi:unnamed protein product [Effrenium voratum]|nr:unnamed protein product [Effrenium voratum]